ncbi:MAG TPA: hypothetical protein VKY37_09210 [Brumimicrobium sp.]|nr:hypothetical protein [Brumimicrobium sp.]
MIKHRYIAFLIVLIMGLCSCSSDNKGNLDSTSEAKDSFDLYEENFEPLVSFDSLLKIEEELDGKLEDFKDVKSTN